VGVIVASNTQKINTNLQQQMNQQNQKINEINMKKDFSLKLHHINLKCIRDK
jgi:hypothetical protein